MSQESDGKISDGFMESIFGDLTSSEHLNMDFLNKSSRICLKHRKLTRFKTTFLLLWTVFLLLQTGLVCTVYGQGDVYDYEKSTYGQSISNLSEEVTTVSWLQFMEEDAKETSEDLTRQETNGVLTMNKPKHSGTEAQYTMDNNETYDTTISWMQFMEKDVIDDRESNPHPALTRLRRDIEDSGSGIGEETTTAVGGSGDEETTTATQKPTTSTTAESTAQTGSGMEETTAQETTTTILEESTVPQTSVCNSCADNQYCADLSTVEKCICNPGYTLQGGTCTVAKQFGGKLHMDVVFDSRLEDSSTDFYIEQEEIYTNVLETAYMGEDWFVAVKIIGFSNGSTIVDYELTTKDDDAVNSTTIQATFEEFLQNTTYFTNCDCGSETCSPQNLGVNASVKANDTCVDAGTATSILCDSPDISSYCNSTTTTCSANLDGEIFCQCQSGFTADSKSNRSCVVITVCQGNSGCNQPFGTCRTTYCACMWGFQGTNCQEAWLFILIVVLSGLILLALIAGAVVACRRKRATKEWATYEATSTGVYNDSSSAKFERYINMSEWDEQIGGIVPTSFKNMNDSEPYDDLTFVNDEASATNESNHEESNDQQLPLRQWRVSQVTNGSGMQRAGGDYAMNDLDENGEKERKESTMTIQRTKI